MTLSISEANALNSALQGLLGMDGPGGPVGDKEALSALKLLVFKARKALGAGLTEERVQAAWERHVERRDAVSPPLVGRLAADALAVGWGEDDDGNDVITVANTALIPSRTLVEMSPMDAIQIGAQLVLSGHEAIDTQQRGEPELDDSAEVRHG